MTRPTKSPRVLFVTPEASPLLKIGGLGDVAGSLPIALSKRGVDIRLLIPYADQIRLVESESRIPDMTISFRGEKTCIRMYTSSLPGKSVPIYLPWHPLFSGENLFDPRRFVLLSAVACAISRGPWVPNLIHGNDWFSGKTIAEATTMGIPTLLTIHNLSYNQKELGLGIEHATKLNTVSPRYSSEIQTDQFGGPLAPLLRSRKQDLSGILNGIDVGRWNPQQDRAIAITYTRQSVLRSKRHNKETLLQRLALSISSRFLLGFIGRLDPHQKGIDKVLSIIPTIVRQHCSLVILGVGDDVMEKKVRMASLKYKRYVAATLRFDEKLAHQIYAGVDAIVIPSTFEPCGLVQMIAMRYGTIPIAHRVGGLSDTIDDGKTGFLYTPDTASALETAIRSARLVSKHPQQWALMVNMAMRQDFSWDKSATRYVDLYGTMLPSHRWGRHEIFRRRTIAGIQKTDAGPPLHPDEK